MSESQPQPRIMDYLREFVCELTLQLKSDHERWGHTWLSRSKIGQELRTKARYDDYFDQFIRGNTPMPWLKIVGGALICWIRDNHPEVCKEEPHPMLCFQHGGSSACEEVNSKHGFVCPKCNWIEKLPPFVDVKCSHPEGMVCPDCVSLKEKPIEDMTEKELIESPSECGCNDCNLPDLGKLDPPPPENEHLKEGDAESRVPGIPDLCMLDGADQD